MPPTCTRQRRSPRASSLLFAGIYRVDARARWASDSQGDRGLTVNRNGTSVAGTSRPAASGDPNRRRDIDAGADGRGRLRPARGDRDQPRYPGGRRRGARARLQHALDQPPLADLGCARVLATPRLAAVADGGGRRAVRRARRGAAGALGAGVGRAGHRGPALQAARRPGQAEGHRAGGHRLPEPAGAGPRCCPCPAACTPAPSTGLRRAGARARWSTTCSSPSPPNPADDNALFDAVRRAGNVVLATSEVREDGGTDVLGGPANQRAARAGWATRRCRRPTPTA